MTSNLCRFDNLQRINWDFSKAKTNHLTHCVHPYPAKFIPQIPHALISELSSVGDVVGDIFCGSGTTLVEALLLKRNAIGIDANPLACLMSKTKTSRISDADAVILLALSKKAREMGDSLSATNDNFISSSSWRPDFPKLDFWFKPYVIEELAEIKLWCSDLSTPQSRDLALTSLSSIVVAVSRQDSDTRYVRRSKNILQGETFKRFARSLDQAVSVIKEFSVLVEPNLSCSIIQASLLDSPKIPQLDLVVCSPPYPNAYSYHLYHMSRMLWLGMDQPKFKKEEIGSHRKYSSNGKNAATVETFKTEFTHILKWLSSNLKPEGYACFVVGDSTLKGVKINNTDLITEAGKKAGFVEATRIRRTIQSTKKAFNPAIGTIKKEVILILKNRKKA